MEGKLTLLRTLFTWLTLLRTLFTCLTFFKTLFTRDFEIFLSGVQGQLFIRP
jgi:hypothetical protein